MTIKSVTGLFNKLTNRNLHIFFFESGVQKVAGGFEVVNCLFYLQGHLVKLQPHSVQYLATTAIRTYGINVRLAKLHFIHAGSQCRSVCSLVLEAVFLCARQCIFCAVPLFIYISTNL